MDGDSDTPTRAGAGTGPAAGQHAGPAVRGGAGSLTFDNPRDDIYRVRVSGPLDTLTGNRVLRLIDARLRVVALGGTATRSIMVDLADAESAAHPGVDALRHAHYACRAAGVTFGLLGAARLTARLPANARHGMSRIPSHPTLDAALAATAATDARPDPGEPDALR